MLRLVAAAAVAVSIEAASTTAITRLTGRQDAVGDRPNARLITDLPCEVRITRRTPSTRRRTQTFVRLSSAALAHGHGLKGLYPGPAWTVATLAGVGSLEADLADYYDSEAAQRAARELDPRRVERRESFVQLLAAERRTRLVEIGTGPGRDATAFLAAGLSVSGVDLSAEHVRLSREAGVDAQVASVHQMPFADDSFDAGWTMSTLLHVPDADFDAALREICRVLRAGSPLAVGLWGGTDSEGRSDRDEIRPPRFFSTRSHDRIQQMLGRHGAVESFQTWTSGPPGSWEYQWAVLRTSLDALTPESPPP